MTSNYAIRLIHRATTLEQLNEVWHRVSQVAWSNNAVRQAYETRRAVLVREDCPNG